MEEYNVTISYEVTQTVIVRAAPGLHPVLGETNHNDDSMKLRDHAIAMIVDGYETQEDWTLLDYLNIEKREGS